VRSSRVVPVLVAAAAVTALAACSGGSHPTATATSAAAPKPTETSSVTQPQLPTGPLIESLYTADPSGHVYDGTLYIYPSHDIPTDIPADDNGSQYAMRDYHVLSMATPAGPAKDNGVALDVDQVPWAAKEMWAPDAGRKGDTYYLFFPAMDHQGVFRIGVATSTSPTGPFTADPKPIAGSYSIDPAVFTDDDGSSYMYFGGLLGGQLQNYRDDKPVAVGQLPSQGEPALGARVVKMTDDLDGFAEPTREVVILDENGKPLTQGDDRAFFEASWMTKRDGTYYFMYSTGDSHHLAYATGSSPYGPFTYRGVVLEPVKGWTTHGSIVQWGEDWYLLYHSAERSGQDNLRDVRIAALHFTSDGSIRTLIP
jgi:hypothetical protein